MSITKFSNKLTV